MAEVSKLAALINGLIQNINTSTSDLDTNSIWVGGTSSTGTQLTQAILNNLVSYGQSAVDSLTGDVTASGPGAAAASLTATTNSTLTTLSALSLPASQLTGLSTAVASLTAANISATSNSTLTTLSSLSLPYSQVTGGPSAGANQTLSNLTSPTSVNESLFPASNSLLLGQVGSLWGNVYTTGMTLYDSNGSETFIAYGLNTLPDSSTFNGLTSTFSAGNNTTVLGLASVSLASAGSHNTGDIRLETGNITGTGTGTTGNVVLRPGSSTGTVGKIQFKNSSEGTAGNVWTSSDTAGSGYWAAASSGSVTSVSVVSANGLAGTVATATTTPAITLSTTINSPVLAGNGTAISAAATTGTGSTVVLSASPTITGTLSTSAISASGALNMNSNQINDLAMAGSPASTDATNVTYVNAQIAAAVNGLTWKGPVQAYSDSNVPLTGGATLTIDSYSVQNGDYVILGNQTTAAQNYVYVASGIGTAYVLTLVAGSEAPTAVGDAYLVENGTVYGNTAFQVNATSPNVTFIQFAGPNTYTFTSPLSLTGNVVSVGYDNSTIGVTSGNLYVKNNGITYTQLQQVAASSLVGNPTGSLANAEGITLGSTLTFSGSALQTTAMTGDITTSANSFATTLATVNTSPGTYAIATVTVNGKGLVTAATAAATTGTGSVMLSASPTTTGTLSGAAASFSGQVAAASVSSPFVSQTMVAGQSFTANTSYLVRMGQSTDGGSYQGRVYAADPSAATTNNNFWVIGVASSSSSVTAGQSIAVTMLGTYTLASSDTGFSAGTNGQAVWLSTSGALTLTPPSTSGYADVKVGTVQTTGSGTSSSMLVNGIQLTGIYN